MSSHRYSIEKFKQAVESSYSIREALSKLGVVQAGGNYKVFKQYAQRNAISLDHFKGQRVNKGKRFGYKRPLSDYLSNTFSIQSNKLKLRLLREGIFNTQCSICLLKTWESKPIPLELDHINGDSSDNSLNNLRIICPNCHALTSNYRGKNIKPTKA